MKIQKWKNFVPKQFVNCSKDGPYITYNCTSEQAVEITKFIDETLQHRVWVVDCNVGDMNTNWLQVRVSSCLYSLAFESVEDYQKFLTKFDDDA